ncbi:LacI family DNA-binding transcriptional regulator [Pseudalkalibacillus hwajinpoensis]|uniref:LacI family DNA-binding transcriptional regulator n=1 Tax=Guptibacillus hwajinpoensis TaxID=208199 RepID=UPI00325ABEDB
MKREINITEVAKKAGVSIATVSRVFNNQGPVKESTRKKIQQIIEETGYSPNILARELAEQKTHLIGIIVHDLTGEGIPRVINGVNEVLGAKGYNLLITCTNGSLDNELKQFEIFRSKRVEGILFATRVFQPEHSEIIKKLPIPVVSLLQNTEQAAIPYVAFDNYHFAYEGTKRLIDLGHKTIGFIGGPKHSINGEERFKGYIDAHKDAGIQCQPDIIVNGNYHIEDGYHKMEIIYSIKQGMTAVVAANDGMAIGALNYLQDSGVVIPDEVSVLALDDTVLAKASRLKLSGVHYSYTELGQKGAAIMMKMIENAHFDFEKSIIPYEICMRESVAAINSEK